MVIRATVEIVGELQFGDRAILGLLRQDRKSASASRTVNGEVPPIEREDAREIFAFGDPDERRVGEIHRQVAVLLHQLAHARRIAFIERRQCQRPGFHTAPEGLLAGPRRPQQVHGFGERRPDRDQRIAERS